MPRSKRPRKVPKFAPAAAEAPMAPTAGAPAAAGVAAPARVPAPAGASVAPAPAGAARAARGRSALATSRRRRGKGGALPWIVGSVGLGLLIAIQIGVTVVGQARLPGERFASQGNVHVALGASTPPYNSDPPTSGWHTAELAPWGSHLEVQHDQRLVHNMEDGGVVLWYANGTPEENRAHVAALEAVVPRAFSRVVIAPRDGMPTTYAATAWQRLQRFEAIDAEAMQAFIAAYHGVDNHR
jgi:hypothetical protein